MRLWAAAGDKQSKSISIEKQTYANVGHLRGFGEADRLADETFAPRP